MKNTVKKVLCTFIAVVVAASATMVFTGCGAKKNTSDISIPDITISQSSDESSKEEESSKAEESSKEEESSKAEESSKEEEGSKEEEKDSDTVDPDFKETMDAYEDFMNSYVDFMKKYNNSSNPVSLMKDYTEYMSKYADMVDKIDNIDEDSLSKADLDYYIDVTSRVTKKLAEVAE